MYFLANKCNDFNNFGLLRQGTRFFEKCHVTGCLHAVALPPSDVLRRNHQWRMHTEPIDKLQDKIRGAHTFCPFGLSRPEVCVHHWWFVLCTFSGANVTAHKYLVVSYFFRSHALSWKSWKIETITLYIMETHYLYTNWHALQLYR